MRLLPPLLLLAGCGCGDTECGGILRMNIAVDGAPVQSFSGTIAVGEHSFDVDCGVAMETSEAIVCGDSTLTLDLGTFDVGSTVVSWSLTAVTRDTGDTFDGEGSLTPAWESFAPNGEACGPVCWSADTTADLAG
jgi:hypothetical protein